MFVALDPSEEGTAPHQLAPPKGEGRDGRTAAHATGDGFTDMCLRAVKQRRNVIHCEEVELLQ